MYVLPNYKPSMDFDVRTGSRGDQPGGVDARLPQLHRAGIDLAAQGLEGT